MNRQEPYIGMPIILASFDDAPASTSCCGQTEIQPRTAGNDAADTMADRREQRQHQQMNQMQQTQQRQPMVLAMAYVPWQRWQETYPLEEGLHKGTIFPELYLPFEGRREGGNRR